MATPKFIEITEDPWINLSEEFVFVYSCANSAPSSIYLKDTVGNTFETLYSSLNTNSMAYPYFYQVTPKILILIPPNFTLVNHLRFVGLQGSLEDLRGYI